MCGRAAQTYHSVYEASKALGVTPPAPPPPPADDDDNNNSNNNSSQRYASSNDASSSSKTTTSFPWRDNFNLSPGMDAYVIRRHVNTNSSSSSSPSSTLSCDRMVWGLVTKGGTSRKPLPPRHNPQRMALHFNNNMFNARSDTLLTKPTFCRLLSTSSTTSSSTSANNIHHPSALPQTCIVMLRGYFEWKTELKQKQPYFVYSANHPYVLIAGLWNTVATGLTPDEDDNEEDAHLSTFCILTTDATRSMQWLHHRMPLCVWDYDLAQQWLHVGEANMTKLPLPALLDQLEQSNVEASTQNALASHAVSREMTNLQFREERAIQAIPKPKRVSSFFAAKASATTKPAPKVAPNVATAAKPIKQESGWKQPAATAKAIKQEDIWKQPNDNNNSATAISRARVEPPEEVKSRASVDSSPLDSTARLSGKPKPDTAASVGMLASPPQNSNPFVPRTSFSLGWSSPSSLAATFDANATPTKPSPKPTSASTPKHSSSSTKNPPKRKKQQVKPSPAKKKAGSPAKKAGTSAKKEKAGTPTKAKGTPGKAKGSPTKAKSNTKKAASPKKSTQNKPSSASGAPTTTPVKSPFAKSAATPDKASSANHSTPTNKPVKKESPAKKQNPQSKTITKTTTTKVTPAKTTKVTTTKTIVNHGAAKTTKVTTTTTTTATKSPTPSRSGKKAKTDPNSIPITSFFSPKNKSPK